MNYSKFSIRIPLELRRQLEEEALNQSRSLNNQISTILKERYNAHAPPVSPIHSRSVSKSHNKQNGRKTKAAIS